MTTDPKQDVRQQFEAWARENGMHTDRYRSIDCYIGADTDRAWRACQATLQSPAVRDLVEAANAVADFTPENQREKWSCHYGITTAAKCGRCSRDLRLAAALRTLGAGHVE